MAPPLPFVYMGKMQAAAEQWSFFLVKGDIVYAVREGDIIDKNYRVEGVSGGQLTFTYLPLKQKQFIYIGDPS